MPADTEHHAPPAVLILCGGTARYPPATTRARQVVRGLLPVVWTGSKGNGFERRGMSAIPISRPKPELTRQTFTVSRELEYLSESELVTQTGYPKKLWWPGVLVKELVDNAIDACEQAGVAPSVNVFCGSTEISITPDVVARILDFSSRTSDKAAYVSPTRGAQGNALKTVLAIPYILNQERTGTVEIESRGIRHVIAISKDQIARRPRIDHSKVETVKNEGTVVRVLRDSPCSKADESESNFLPKLVADYALFNPHVTFTLRLEDGREHRFKGQVGWQKWLPSDPTPAEWYTIERFEELVASYVAAGKQRTVREFVAEFRGLSGTAKRKQVVTEAGLERAYLHDLACNSQLDRTALQRLLASMRKASKPVKPKALGVLGKEHFRRRMELADDDHTFTYGMVADFHEGLPYVAEFAFAKTDIPHLQGMHVGLNWSVPLSNPFQAITLCLGEETSYGLESLLARNYTDLDHDPVCLALHVAYPRFTFLDRGKGSVGL
jgi:DNA topoisomerase VI subunit B